jgi:hypothetical protein
MTILETLQTDHRQVKVLLETILSTNHAKKRGDLFKQFRTELTAHSRVEEMVLYRRMEKSEEGKDDALEGAVEHEARASLSFNGAHKRRLSWLPQGSRLAARLRRPRRSFQHAMADRCRCEGQGPLGSQGVRPLGVPPSAVARPLAWCAERSGIQG